MNWQDEGFLLSKNNFDENSLIIETFTLNHGKYTGIVYGGSSRKLKKILQIGNKMMFFLKSKNENRVGYFSLELIKPVTPLLFNEKKRITAILSATNLLKILLPERQSNKKIYESFNNLIDKILSDIWIKNYIFWELSLIKELGFEVIFPDFNEVANTSIDEIQINNKHFKIPKIFFDRNELSLTNHDIRDALLFNKKLLLENFALPNRLNLPYSRNVLEQYFK